MEEARSRHWKLGLVGQYMNYFIIRFISAAIFMLISNQSFSEEPEMSKNGIPSDSNFYFGRMMIDISASDAEVPRVDRDTVQRYDNLGLLDQFHIGRSDDRGQLVYLETWLRQPVEEVSLGMVVDGMSLESYIVPIVRGDIESQKPQFFMRKEGRWRHVSPDETIGESIFIRLRLLSPLRGGAPQKDAEVFRQYLSSVYEYTYDVDGAINRIVMRSHEDDFAQKVVFDRSK